MKKTSKYLSLLVVTLIFLSCKKKEDPDPVVTSTLSIPNTYAFNRSDSSTVNYSGQTTRLNMLREMVSYIKDGINNGTSLDAAVLKNMYANANTPFTDAALNASTKQLKDKTFIGQADFFEDWMDSLALYMVDANAMSASIQTNNDGSKYAFTPNGVEPLQIIEKGLMGAIFYYQSVSYYLDGIATDDNTTISAGENYTTMEHHFDEAFGYFGVAEDFPNTLPTDFWGKYCNSQDASYNTNHLMSYNFRKGRAAIVAKDMNALNEAVLSIRLTWEKIAAAQAHAYLNSYISNVVSDNVKARHALSEAYAFLYSIQFSPVATRRLTPAQINQFLNTDIGLDFNNINLSNINAVISTLETTYEL